MSTKQPLSEEKESLWLLTVSPTVWAAHFLLCYLTAAIWCAKFAGVQSTLDFVRLAIAVYTAVALAIVAVNGWAGWQRHRYALEATQHDFDSREGRHRFLGFATLLLSALSAIATIFVAMVAFFFEDCR